MSYIGRGVDAISNVEKLDNITFNGGTTYALTKSSIAFTPVSANSLLVSIDGVVQQGNFSVSTTNIVFDWSPTSSNTCNFILHYGTGVLNVPADGSIVAAKMAANSVDSDSYVDGSIDAAHIASDAVTTAKILDDNVTAAKMADNSIDSDAYVDASIDNAHLADNAVDTAEIADNAVSLAKMAGLVRGKIIYGDASGDPAALTVGSAGTALTSDGTDVSWGVAGTAWQSVLTGHTTMVAGRGYFVNTTGGAINMTLPSGPTIGDFIHIIDYAGTFDTNNCTVVRATHPIQGAASDLVVATERAGFKLVFVDATQGWLLTEK